MGSACTTDADIMRKSGDCLIIAGDFLAQGKSRKASEYFDKGLKVLPFHQYVTSDVIASTDGASSGIVEGAAEVASRNREFDQQLKLRRHRSQLRSYTRSPLKPDEAAAFRQIVTHLRRATQMYGNMSAGMDSYDLERAIGGGIDEGKEGLGTIPVHGNIGSDSGHAGHSREELATNGNPFITLPSTRRRTFVHFNDTKVHPSSSEPTLEFGNHQNPWIDKERRASASTTSFSESVEDFTGHQQKQSSVARGDSVIPTISMTAPSVSTQDALPSITGSILKSPVATSGGKHADGGLEKECQVVNRNRNDRQAMRITLNQNVNGGATRVAPALAAKSALALFAVKRAEVIESVLRVLQYRLMMGDYYLINSHFDASETQYLMVSGATMLIRAKDQLHVYLQSQTQQIHERACLGISAVALTRARRAMQDLKGAAFERGDDDGRNQPTFASPNRRLTAHAEINRHLAIALQHSMSVRKAGLLQEAGVISDVMRTPYNLSLSSSDPLGAPYHDHHHYTSNRNPENMSGRIDAEEKVLLGESALAREELMDRVRKQEATNSAVVRALLSEDGTSVDAMKVGRMLSAQMGTALRGVSGASSSVTWPDGTQLWTCVPLIDALRLEAETRLEIILFNNTLSSPSVAPPSRPAASSSSEQREHRVPTISLTVAKPAKHRGKDAASDGDCELDADDCDEQEDGDIVGTRGDAQNVITGLQKAVGLCLCQYSSLSPEYKRLKQILDKAKQSLHWRPKFGTEASLLPPNGDGENGVRMEDADDMHVVSVVSTTAMSTPSSQCFAPSLAKKRKSSCTQRRKSVLDVLRSVQQNNFINDIDVN